MPLQLAANLSFMFREHVKLLPRYQAARAAGFRGVEVAFPYEEPLHDVLKAKEDAGVEQVLINSWPGDLSKGDLGIAIFPERRKEFQNTLLTSIEYAKTLNCSKLHIMAGKLPEGFDKNEANRTYESNLKFAVKLLEQTNIVGVIEPINNYSVPQYFLNSFDEALKVIKTIQSPYLKLQLDIFHLQHICGNLTNNITNLLPYTAHIQVAQVPQRHEPTSPGEINYKYVIDLLKARGYEGWIGCEYNPKEETVKGLDWISACGLSL